MASQDFITQIIGSVLSNPDLLTGMVEHPYSAVREASGQQDVSRDDVGQALAALSMLGSGQNLDFGNLASMASTLLSQNNNSAHDMAASLFGMTPQVDTNAAQVAAQQAAAHAAAAQQAADQAARAAGLKGNQTVTNVSADADLISSILGNLGNVSINNKGIAGVNINDGIDITDVMGLASMFLGGKK